MMNHSKKINHHQIECISLKCVSKYPNVGKGHGFWVRFCFLPITSLYVEILRCLGHRWEPMLTFRFRPFFNTTSEKNDPSNEGSSAKT